MGSALIPIFVSFPIQTRRPIPPFSSKRQTPTKSITLEAMSNSSAGIGCSPTMDAAFGPAVAACRDSFDFTIVFEQSIFTLLPASLLLLAAPARLAHLRKLPHVITGKGRSRMAKLIIIALFSALQLALVALWSSQPPALGGLRTVCIAASSVAFVASLVVFALSYSEHTKSRRPSAVLNAYLFVSLILDMAIVRTFWLASPGEVPSSVRGVFTASFALKALLLVLEALEKAPGVGADGVLRNPEAASGLYSQGLFWWLNPLLLDGFRRLLKPADMYGLDESLSSAVLSAKFWPIWNRGLWPI